MTELPRQIWSVYPVSWKFTKVVSVGSLIEMQIAGGADKTRDGFESPDVRKPSLPCVRKESWREGGPSSGGWMRTARATRALDIILTEGGVCADGNTLFAEKAERAWAMVAAQEQSFDCKGIIKGTTRPRKLS